MKRESDELNLSQKNHISETILDNYDKFDYVIDNSGTLEDLENKAKEILEKIGEDDEKIQG